MSATGCDPAGYDLIAQIDLDAQITFGNAAYPGLFSDAGGLALQGCSTVYPFSSHVSIWSVMTSPNEIRGTLVMVLNLELSHLFGLVDNWPFRQGTVVYPDGSIGDDWIPYEMFGWTDADGDGVIEILDPTPYGSGGPRP